MLIAAWQKHMKTKKRMPKMRAFQKKHLPLQTEIKQKARQPERRQAELSALRTYEKLPDSTQQKGLTGFDSGLKWYVSTRSLVGYLLKRSEQQINWQQQVCSRCLIEAQ